MPMKTGRKIILILLVLAAAARRDLLRAHAAAGVKSF